MRGTGGLCRTDGNGEMPGSIGERQRMEAIYWDGKSRRQKASVKTEAYKTSAPDGVRR